MPRFIRPEVVRVDGFIRESLEDVDFPVESSIERPARTCYKSEGKIAPGTAQKMIGRLVNRGHFPMIEFGYAAAHYVCNRGVTHELVRHRLTSLAQESTRYVDYTKSRHGGEVAFIIPPELEQDPDALLVWKKAMIYAEEVYYSLRGKGHPAQIARGVLPIDVKTEIHVAANLREWRHIFAMRCADTAHPHIRKLMKETLARLAQKAPTVFADQVEEFLSNGR